MDFDRLLKILMLVVIILLAVGILGFLIKIVLVIGAGYLLYCEFYNSKEEEDHEPQS